jgi:DNA-binding protein H-NS
MFRQIGENSTYIGVQSAGIVSIIATWHITTHSPDSHIAVDIKSLNHSQLNDLINKAQLRQNEMRKEKVVKLREKINSLIKAEGYTFEDVFGTTRKTKRAGAKVAPKYRNPANPTQTWSGRGKRPHWFNDALKAGKKEKDLAI